MSWFSRLFNPRHWPKVGRHLRRRIYRCFYQTTIVLVLGLMGLLLPQAVYTVLASSDRICNAELNVNSAGNRSFEILQKCLQNTSLEAIDRGEILRRLALMDYDRLGATGKDRTGAGPRSQKIQSIERQINDSIEIAKTAGDTALLSRAQYTLGQIRLNEVTRSLDLIKPDSIQEGSIPTILALQTQIQQTLQPLSESNQIQAKLYQARLLTQALPTFYSAVDRQRQKVEQQKMDVQRENQTWIDQGLPPSSKPDRALQEDLDRLSQQTRTWTADLLQLLPQIESQLQSQASASTADPEAVALMIYHANTLSKLQPVRSTANQLENAKPIDPKNSYEQFLTTALQTQLAQESDRADRQAVALLTQTIRSANATPTTSPEDAKLLRKLRLQATQNLARLYDKHQQREVAAALLTPEVLLEADAIDSPELAGLLYGRYVHVQLDRLKCKVPTRENARDCQGLRQASDTALRRIELVRGDLLSLSPDLQYSYREGIEPLYRDNIELQLAAPKPDLEAVLTRMESLKLAEVHNYFREPCVEPKVKLTRFINQRLPNTNLIYTIAMDDRLEIIVKLAGSAADLHRYRTTIPRTQLESTAKLFRSQVIGANNPQSTESQALYNWIFRSTDGVTGRTLESDLQAESTLVMVSDSGLREIPMAALFDGKQLLIDRFAVALSPGLTLFDPRPVRSPNVMFAGQTKFDGLNPLTGTKVELLDLQADRFLPEQSPSNQVLMSDGESKYLPFTLQNFEASVSRQGFNVVHLATHANFSSQQDQTFIVMGDEKVGTEAFSEALRKRDRNREDTIELLILSACKTAEGDDRAALGLAGLALRSGARSTIASLWTVDDATEVTPKLLRQFYRSVFTSKLSKAQALRQAQLTLKETQPSSRWAPYVVVGNWL